MTAAHARPVLWITWESQVRNRSMARELHATLIEILHDGPRVLRYLRSGWATTRFLLIARPVVVCAPNPSVVLTCWLLLLRPFLGFRLASDAHYGGVEAVNGSALLQRLLDLANRLADVVIVTNHGHADRIRRLGGTPVVCPDPLPDVPGKSQASSDGSHAKTVLFVCSFDADEPYDAVLAAAPVLAARGFQLLISGNYHKAGLRQELVSCATLLGYVDREVYDRTLCNASVVLDLTTFQDCLVCGAYEAMAAGKPCVLSDTPALRRQFTHGTVFTGHEPSEIVSAIADAFEHRERLHQQAAEWCEAEWSRTRQRIAELRSVLELPGTDAPTGPPRIDYGRRVVTTTSSM